MRNLQNPSAGSTIVGILKPHEGGTGQVTPSATLLAMQAIALAKKNQPNGIAGLDKDGRLLTSVIAPETFSSISIVGPTVVLQGTQNVYTIRNFDSFTEYDIQCSVGSLSVSEDEITYTAPQTLGNAGFNINGREFVIAVTDTRPLAPSVTSPVNLSNISERFYTFTSSAYLVGDAGSTHESSDWRVSTTSDFSNVVLSSTDSVVNKTNYSVSDLTDGQTYYVSVRYKSNNGSYSDWSSGIAFTVAVPVPLQPTITSHANNGSVNQGTATFTTSAYSILNNASIHQSTDWQLSTVSDFSTIFASSLDDTTNKTSWPVTGLVDGASYYLRARHKATNGKISPWSTSIRLNVVFAFLFSPVIAALTTNYNMKAAAIAAGWNQTMPLFMEVTLAAGTVIGSSNTSGYAFDTGSGFPAGTTLKLTVNSGATIAGAGGSGSSSAGVSGANGGPALIARAPLTVSNTGVIGGGGGGGGVGAPGVYKYFDEGSIYGTSPYGSDINYSVGGGGGGGQGAIGGLGGPTVGSGTGPFNYYNNASAGQTGTISSPGAGGSGSYGHQGSVAPNTYTGGGSGGAGGSLGQPGSSGGNAFWTGQNYNGGGANSVTDSTGPFNEYDQNVSPPGAGGIAGAAVTGNTFITWNSTGTRLGQIT